METQLLNTSNIQATEMINLEGITEGCNQAIVTYGLYETFGKKDIKIRKIVVLYDSNDTDFETVNAGVNRIMMRLDTSIVKSYKYSLLDRVLKRLNVLSSILYKNVFGFVPNGKISDCSDLYSDYLNGRD